MDRSWTTLKERIRPFAARYGLAIAVGAALPAMAWLLAQPEPRERFRPLFMAARHDAAAVRAIAGPGGPSDRPDRTATPEFVKGIYVNASTAGQAKRFAELVRLVDDTEINAMVIDIKADRGRIAFAPVSDALKPYAAEDPPLGDLKEFTAPLREKGIYLIARTFVFQDPWYAEKNPEYAVKRAGGGLWRDRRGTTWLDPAADPVWKYNAAVAKEAYLGGFDEIQFDYIRFPSDGTLSTIVYPQYDGKRKKEEVMADFFLYLDAELRQKNGIPISVDLFGLTLWQHENDLNIGQKLDVAARHFDFISPMVYPSHYPTGFNGLANPAAHPYEVVHDNLVRGQKVFDRLRSESEALVSENPAAAPVVATVRPWIQDFHMGATYTAAMVRAQMDASVDGGASGWLVWNAGNVYTVGAFDRVEKNGQE